jgi:hypothetical protein
MFDALVQELASRFGLGGNADALVRILLTYLFQEQPGRLNGFLERFRRAGLGDLVNSVDQSHRGGSGLGLSLAMLLGAGCAGPGFQRATGIADTVAKQTEGSLRPIGQ